jgi:hypothetical protein
MSKNTNTKNNSTDNIPTVTNIDLDVVEKALVNGGNKVIDKAMKQINDGARTNTVDTSKNNGNNGNNGSLAKNTTNKPIENQKKRATSPETGKLDYKYSKEFTIFQNELQSLINNNLFILKECKTCKRLLDIKYSDLESTINYIQISVIVLSTMSGFLQSTKNYFDTAESIVSVSGISISTYISLILSVSKYYKYDEQKERIQTLREKYANLHNKIEYRMDVLGPHTKENLWEHQNVVEKLEEWSKIKTAMDEEYLTLIETKQSLTTEYESIMDSKSRNQNYIKDRELVLMNREKVFKTLEKHTALEKKIKEKDVLTDWNSVIQLPDDDLNNWDDPV